MLTNIQLQSVNMSILGNRVKDLIERKRISAHVLSKELNLDKSHLSRFLNGKAQYSLKKLTIIADYFGYDIDFVKRKRSKKKGEKDGLYL